MPESKEKNRIMITEDAEVLTIGLDGTVTSSHVYKIDNAFSELDKIPNKVIVGNGFSPLALKLLEKRGFNCIAPAAETIKFL